ncbi:MAG: transposase [Nannocystis sp.]|uniref:transposase n=1 Tax=Nannocystis sp. TaxID=1962667 RepID=UPI00242693EE|nr:transposase [Nannocystis sp.]
MTTITRRHHTAEFQANAVRRLNNPGQSVQELADELKVTRSLLYRWRRAASTKEGPMPKKKPHP